jgi:hypothetical protein
MIEMGMMGMNDAGIRKITGLKLSKIRELRKNL